MLWCLIFYLKDDNKKRFITEICGMNEQKE